MMLFLRILKEIIAPTHEKLSPVSEWLIEPALAPVFGPASVRILILNCLELVNKCRFSTF
jgi:hypothetical protein